MSAPGSLLPHRPDFSKLTHTNDPELLRKLYFDAAIRADERRVMCDEKDETIKRLTRRLQELQGELEASDCCAIQWEDHPEKWCPACLSVRTTAEQRAAMWERLFDHCSETLVERWHAIPPGTPGAPETLHEFMGLTWEQYSAFVEGRWEAVLNA